MFGKFFDFGYPFSKTIAILILSYATFFLGTIKLLPFSQISLLFLVAVAAIVNFQILKRDNSIKDFLRRPFRDQFPLIFEEVLFFAALLFLAIVRGQEPSIRGLEKFMDFGFMNSILHSKFFPPLDMWYSADPTHPQGYPINYYYFGHLTGAFLMKLTNLSPFVGYNLILATIFAQAITIVFSLCANLVHLTQSFYKQAKHSPFTKYFIGIIGSYIVNFGGNLHTIYLFTKGYPNESPIPFWKILSGFNPHSYWYPNATRFIPFTIHEFPSYSYVVADLHGHVFDIPFVLLTLAVLINFFLTFYHSAPPSKKREKKTTFFQKLLREQSLPWAIFLGFMIAVHYMTNAWDLLIYSGVTLIIFFILFRFSKRFFIHAGAFFVSVFVFMLPFSINFKSIVSSIGVNCAPQALVNMQKFGPFLFEKGNCQVSAPWMLFVLWGFFFINFILFFSILLKKNRQHTPLDIFILVLFAFSTCLLIFPEFFYFKDIYPQHFRANTMFKLGYQAFIMMGIASTYTFYLILSLEKPLKWVYKGIFIVIFCFIFVYPFFAFPSYYGNLNRPVNLDGSTWLSTTYPEDKDLITYINNNIKDQSVILEAQGDSYTDYDVISAYTGHPTVAGWWVHEWLWRGSSDVVGIRIPDINTIYESSDLAQTKILLDKFHVQYVIISNLERQKYTNINELKFNKIGKKIFTSSNGRGSLYKVSN